MFPPDSPQRSTVLVIDDEPVVLRCVRAALAADYNLLEADGALSAVELSEKFRGTIDLVITDHSLKGTVGREVIARIQAARPTVRILYLSSYSRDDSANDNLPADAEILEKPFLPRDLRGAIFRILGDRPSATPDGPDSAEAPEPGRGISVRNPACVEALRDEVFRSRSLFGRLIAASRLWNSTKNRYDHRLAGRHGIEDVDDALRLLHHEALVAWLSFSLRQQKADVSIYLDGTPSPATEVRRLQALGRGALPQTAIEPERHLFLSELTVVQKLLQFEFEAGIA